MSTLPHKLINEGGRGAKNHQNLVNVVYECSQERKQISHAFETQWIVSILIYNYSLYCDGMGFCQKICPV